MNSLPDGPLLSYYGDDFTGSTAVLEALAFNGLKTVLFFEEPDAAILAKAGPVRAVGLAGLSRSKSPAWMDAHLPRAFASLMAVGAPLFHYKVCSTFDSAPETGSIGKAIDIGTRLVPGECVQVLTASPHIARWQAFGNLFAGTGGEVFRIDRHPVMMRHPVTPMHDGDLRRHLALQTPSLIGLIDLVDLKSGGAAQKLQRERDRGAKIVLIDMVDDETLERAGELMWESRATNRFVAGSQGVEYALIAHWRREGLLPRMDVLPTLLSVDRIAVVSGSCSPVTAAQIAHAEKCGFHLVRVDPLLTLDARTWHSEIERSAAEALEGCRQGRDPLVYSALGPDDPSIASLDAICHAERCNRQEISLRLGSGLGQILDRILAETGIGRAVVSGGDSSGQACLAMGLSAVTALAPIAPSAPLCLALSSKPHLDGLEIALKGGQMGEADFFSRAKGRQ